VVRILRVLSDGGVRATQRATLRRIAHPRCGARSDSVVHQLERVLMKRKKGGEDEEFDVFGGEEVEELEDDEIEDDEEFDEDDLDEDEFSDDDDFDDDDFDDDDFDDDEDDDDDDDDDDEEGDDLAESEP
jgi:hypothetical protein